MTLKEIAELANVSTATVSLVLNNKKGVGVEKRKEILDIMSKVGYVKHKEEEKIDRVGKNGNIRFIKYKGDGTLVERNGDFISKLIDGIEDKARESGLNLTITNVSSKNFEKLIESINMEKDDGIVFLGTEFCEEDYRLLERINAPIVVVDNEMKSVDIDAVVMNNEQSVYTAIKYLKQLGHNKIGHIKSKYVTDNFKSRNLGYISSLEQLNLKYSPNYVIEACPDIHKACEAVEQYVLSNPKLPTAFFADNDILALGAIRGFKNMGLKIPDDISIIGMDDLIMSILSDPPLTTLKIFKRRLGALAIDRVNTKIEQKSKESVKLLVGAKLIVRQSTCAPVNTLVRR